MPTPADLERVASWHDRNADVNAAKAKLAEKQREDGHFETYQRRAQGHRDYAAIIRAAQKALATREKRGAFIPPTLSEVLAFAREIGWPQDNAKGWFDHFESNGWKVSGKTTMVDWKAGARNGHRRWQSEGGKVQATAKDPEGWHDFLAAHPDVKRRLQHPEHRYAPEYVRAQFLKWSTRK